MSIATAESATPQPVSTRLVSVDALRGFDMLWIVGAGAIVHALEKMSDHPAITFLATQLTHAKWEGFRFYDLIFPLFLYIVGVSMVFSLDKALSQGGRTSMFWRILRRSVLLFAVGVFYYGGLSKPWPDVNLGGVLHRIAACSFFAAIIYLFVRNTVGLVVVSVILLVTFWAMVTFVPIPDLQLDKATVNKIATSIDSDSPSAIASSVKESVRGSYEEGRNLVNYVDFLYLPGKKAQTYYINEGLLSTMPAIVLTLFGAISGLLLKNNRVDPTRKIAWLLGAGAGCVLLGLLWSYQFPLIKRIWTSSFILVAGGLSAILLANFYWIIDVLKWRIWCRPFVWIGSNALTIYVVASIVSFPQLAARFVGGDIEIYFDTQVAKGFGGLVVALVGLLLVVLFARFLYKRQIFLRV